MNLTNRAKGSLLGLATGDAIGTTLEFQRPGTFEPLTDMIGGGPFHLEVGQWTDDTSMALCLAESLIESKEFDPLNQLEKYICWWKGGHLSSNGRCFDIGNATVEALKLFQRTAQPFCGSTSLLAAGNGSIMRLAPIPIFYNGSMQEAAYYAADSSRTTHAAPTCTDGCRYFAALICGALNGIDKSDLLDTNYAKDILPYLYPDVENIRQGSFRKEPPEINGQGWIISTLEAAIWAFNKTTNFKDGCLLAVNLGYDTDTVGAVYGQLAGAYYGEDGIPSEWRSKLTKKELIESYAEKLIATH